MELEEGVYAAEKIVQQRIKKGKKEYLVKWVGCTPDQNTWEPAKNIYDKRLIAAFEQSQQKSPVKRGRKPKQNAQQHHPQERERQVIPFRGGHAHANNNRAVSSSSSSSSSGSSDEADNNDSTRENRSMSASSDDSSSSSSSDDDDEDEESEEDKKTKKGGGGNVRNKSKLEPATKKMASHGHGNASIGTGAGAHGPRDDKSPIRESLKRKAEVIQESGKIGVTITTTPKTSPTSGSGSSFGHDTPSVLEAATNLLSMKHGGTPTSIPHHVSGPPPAKVARTTSSASTGSTGKSTRPNRASTTTGNSNATTNGLTNGNNNHANQQQQIHQEPDALPAEYWMTKQPLADQIVLTDVTVNLTTITVRECKTKDEFFKSGKTGADDSKTAAQQQPQASVGGSK